VFRIRANVSGGIFDVFEIRPELFGTEVFQFSV
jgi:hypothetical protein